MTQITAAKFNQVIIPAFCRPSNLRMYVHIKTQGLHDTLAKGVAIKEDEVSKE